MMHKLQYSLDEKQISLRQEEITIDFISSDQNQISYDMVELDFENFIGKIIHCNFIESEINIITFTQKKVLFHLSEK